MRLPLPRPQQERPPQSPQHLPNAAAPLQRRLPSAVGESSRGRPSSGGRFSQAAGCSHPACTAAAAAAAAASVTVDAPWSRLSRAASHFLAAPLQTTPCWRWQPRRQYGGEAGAAAWRGSSMAAGRRVAGRPAVHVRALLSAEPLRELELEHDHLWATAVSSVIQLQPAGAAHSWRGAADGPRSGTSGGGPGA